MPIFQGTHIFLIGNSLLQIIWDRAILPKQFQYILHSRFGATCFPFFRSFLLKHSDKSVFECHIILSISRPV